MFKINSLYSLYQLFNSFGLKKKKKSGLLHKKTVIKTLSIVSLYCLSACLQGFEAGFFSLYEHI